MWAKPLWLLICGRGLLLRRRCGLAVALRWPLRRRGLTEVWLLRRRPTWGVGGTFEVFKYFSGMPT